MSRALLDLPPEEAERRIIADLVREFGPVHDRTHVAQVVDQAFARLDAHARYKEFVPVLTERLARETLRRETGA